MSHTVYIVHCVDTEGPLYEDPSVPFEMLKSVFQIDIEPTKENLFKLQNKEIELYGKEDAIANLLDPNKRASSGTWTELDKMLEAVTCNTFRNEVLDSRGNGWVFSWFCMDHVGFTGMNPRRRDAGYHNIFDHYMQFDNIRKSQDTIQFHYHPITFSGNYNDSGTKYWGSNLNDILARKIIDRKWFPMAFRPGFHTERPDSNWFLEQWIPFDYANQAIKRKETEQPDLSEGRFGDWRRATVEWEVYHPSHDDYQMKGSCRRWIARCLNMYARIREISIDDVEDAFQRAEERDTLLSFTNHDYKNVKFEVERVREMIKTVSKRYPHVNFEFVNAIEGMRRILQLEPKAMELDMVYEELSDQRGRILVSSNATVFGPQPFLAIKTLEGQYIWDNFDFQSAGHWSYFFDSNTIPVKCVEKIGIAANSSTGTTEVILYDLCSKECQKKIYN